MEGHLPANVTAERFRANQERPAANRARADAPVAPRDGPSLLGDPLLRAMRAAEARGLRPLRRAPAVHVRAGDDVVRRADLPDGRRAGPGRLCRRADPGGVDAGRAGGQPARGRRPPGQAGPVDRRVRAASGAGPLPVPARRAAVPGLRAGVPPRRPRTGAALGSGAGQARETEADCDRSRRSQPTSLATEERAEFLALATDLPRCGRSRPPRRRTGSASSGTWSSG